MAPRRRIGRRARGTRLAPLPVEGGRRAMVRIERILCPCDFSDGSRRALELAGALARWYRADLAAVHVRELAAAHGLPAVLDLPPPVPVSAQVLRAELEAF